MPIRLIMSPPRPITIGFCDSRSTTMLQYRFRVPFLPCGSSNRSMTTALENGISAWVSCSSFSRTISAAKNRSGWSVR